jgi:hypothetical protein
MHCRRLTRLTNAFSKKFENFAAAVALNFAYYNFCKTHGAIRMTPPGPLVWKVARGPLRNWLNAVESKQDYFAKLQVAVSQLHNCGATHVKTVPVHEVFQGKPVWQGDVEIFDLHGQPKLNGPTPGAIWTARTMSELGLLPCWKSRQSIQQSERFRFRL